MVGDVRPWIGLPVGGIGPRVGFSRRPLADPGPVLLLVGMEGDIGDPAYEGALALAEWWGGTVAVGASRDPRALAAADVSVSSPGPDVAVPALVSYLDYHGARRVTVCGCGPAVAATALDLASRGLSVAVPPWAVSSPDGPAGSAAIMSVIGGAVRG